MSEAGAAGTGEGVVVLDASAILAVLYGEPGQEEIRGRMRVSEAWVGAVNLSEVAAKLADGGFEEAEVCEVVGALALRTRSFDEGLAFEAGMLRPETRDRGLSLGDRACVALARRLGAVALTTDGAWGGLPGVEVVRGGEGRG